MRYFISHLILLLLFIVPAEAKQNSDNSIKLNEPYILQHNIERLRMLAKENDPNSISFLQERLLYLNKDAKILTIGCGIGTVEQWMGQNLVPQGYVAGIDLDLNVINAASQEASLKGVKNIPFIQGNIYNLPKEWVGQFDVVYARFLLEHLTDSNEALTIMLSVLKPNGYIIIEDDEYSAIRSEPNQKAIKEVGRLATKICKKLKVDYNIGPKLKRMLRNKNVSVITAEKLEIETVGEFRQLFLDTVIEARPKILENKIVSQAEIDNLILDLNKIVSDPSIKLFSTIYQVCGQKQ